MNEHGPAAGPDEPGDRHTPTVGSQTVASLTAPHFVFVAAPIKLWSTFAQPEQRSITQIEEDRPGLLIYPKLLDKTSVFLRRGDRERVVADRQRHLAQGDSFHPRESSEPNA